MRIYLSDKDKKEVADILEKEYVLAIRINTESGKARVFLGDDSYAEKMGEDFDYAAAAEAFIQEHCSDADPDGLLARMRIENVNRELEGKHHYILHMMSRSGTGSFNIYRLAYYHSGANEILMFVRDVTGDYSDAENNVSALKHAFKNEDDEISGRSSFLKLMSRNIRSPLYSIMGLTRIAENREDGTAFDDYIRKISMSGTYMAETIDDVLDLRRIARHELELHPEKIELKSFFENVSHIISAAIYNKGLKLTMDTSDVSGLSVFADRHGLQQLTVKLLRYAIEYTLRGGRITFRARKLYLGDKTVTIDFSVETRGIVVDRDRLQTMFKPSYVVNKINEDIGSVDMDLIILKSYAMMMHCDTITAETDEKKGTVISLALTLDIPEDDRARAVKSLQPVSLEGVRVLLADDNEINLEIAGKTLENAGMTVTPARNGLEAVNIYRSQRGAFDVILMDILMPVMDGLEASRQIRSSKEENCAEIPIIAMTANAFQENYEESTRAGMNAHLVKPVDPDTLLSVIRQTLADSRA